MRTVFFDVDTQLDFLCPAGALYVPGAETITENLQALTSFAGANGIPIIATTDAHTEDDPEFRDWKPHCVLGTTGQQKLAGTLLKGTLTVTTAPGALSDRAASSAQIILQKQHVDCFTNPNLKPLLEQIKAERFVVYGVVTEVCVRCALFGLLSLARPVAVVTDATKSLDAKKGAAILQQFLAQGGQLTTVAEVTA